MGLMKELVLLPVAPVRGTLWVADRIADEIEREHGGGAAAVRELEQVEEAQRRGELDEREAAERQERIVEEQLMRSVGEG